MTYPTLDTINISNGIGPTVLYVDNVMQNWFFRLILIGVHLILAFGVYKKTNDFAVAIGSAGFITIIIAVLMRIPTPAWIDSFTLAFAIIIGVIEVLVLLFSNKNY